MALLNDPDTYLHVAAGRWMLAHMALPVHDPFSHSLAGATWVPHEWLSEIVLAAVYVLTGWSGLVLLTAAAFAASLALLTRFLLRWAEPFSTLIGAALGGALVLGHLLVRPHPVSRARARPRARARARTRTRPAGTSGSKRARPPR